MERIIRVKEMFETIKTTSGTNDKKKLLAEYGEDGLFIKLLEFTLNTYKITGLSKKKMNKKVKLNPTVELDTIDEAIDYILKNNTGRDEDIANIKSYIQTLPSEVQDFYTDIFMKSYKLGASKKLANSVFGNNFVDEHKIMLACKFEGELSGKVAATTKMDGIRISALVKDGKVKWITRQGKQVEGLNELSEQILKLTNDELFIDGEILALNPQELNSDDLFRKTTRIVNSKYNNKTGLRFVAFDICNLEDYYNSANKEKYMVRRKRLENLVLTNKQELIDVVELHMITDNIQSLQELLDRMVEQGQEGLMLNYIDKNYDFKRSKNILKMKKFNICDCLVLNIFEGDGKYINMLGGINILFEYKGNRHTCSVGSGFTDNERKLYWENKNLLLNKIVEIGYFEISKNKNNNELSMRFPTWKSRIREDKNEISMN